MTVLAEGMRFVILGAGQAGASAAITLRQRGFDGELVMVSAESELPYERPPLSKAYLLAQRGSEDLRIAPAEWFAEHDIRLMLGERADGVDPEAHTITLSGGDTIRYDELLITTGSRPRRPPVPGADRALTLRTRADADLLRSRLRPGAALVVIGGGFIGCEVASAAIELGAAVTIIELADRLLPTVLDMQAAAAVSRLHRRHGVELSLGESVTGLSAGLVHTAAGDVRADVVLAATGVVPDLDFLAGSGLAGSHGIEVDEFCRSTVADVFAAGDVASHWHPLFGRRLRVEHYDNAVRQGVAAGKSMLGTREPYLDPHSFTSEQFGHVLQSVGIAAGADQEVLRGDARSGVFTQFWLRAGVVQGVFGIDSQRDIAAARRLISAAATIDADRLADPAADLRALARELARVRA